MKKKQNYGSVPFMMVLAIFLGLLLLLYTVFDINSNQRELEKLMEEQSKALTLTLQQSSKNNVKAFDNIEKLLAEKLLFTARMISEFYYLDSVSDSLLAKIAEENNVFRINIYNSDGESIFSDSPESFGGKTASPGLMRNFNDETTNELVLGFRGGRFGNSQRFAVAKRTKNNAFILVNIDSQQMLEFRRTIGLGALIQELSDVPEIEYILLQDTLHLLAASPPVDSVVSILADDFLSNAFYNDEFSSRLIKMDGKYIYEVVQPYYLQTNNKHLLRVGTDGSHLVQAKRNSIIRAILSSLIILVIMIVISRWLLGKKVYERLQQRYNKMQSYTDMIFSHMQDAVIGVDADFNIMQINKATTTLFGLTEKSIGKSCKHLRPELLLYLQKTKESEQSRQWKDEQIVLKKRNIALSISTNLIKNKNDIEIIFAVMKDITAQKRLEENLKRKENINAMGHLAAGVAHEIRNPLNSISMLSQRLKLEFTPQYDEKEYQELTATIANETSRINKIINRFLEYAKPQKVLKSKFEISQLMDEIKILFQMQAEQKQIDLQVKYDATECYGDFEKLKQVLINLVKNSFDACNTNGKIRIACFVKNDTVYIKVSDDGQGIETQDLSKIFNLYYTTKKEGSGIGLGIVQQIIAQHNGEIHVESELNKGTVFTIQIPKVQK